MELANRPYIAHMLEKRNRGAKKKYVAGRLSPFEETILLCVKENSGLVSATQLQSDLQMSEDMIIDPIKNLASAGFLDLDPLPSHDVNIVMSKKGDAMVSLLTGMDYPISKK